MCSKRLITISECTPAAYSVSCIALHKYWEQVHKRNNSLWRLIINIQWNFIIFLNKKQWICRYPNILQPLITEITFKNKESKTISKPKKKSSFILVLKKANKVKANNGTYCRWSNIWNQDSQQLLLPSWKGQSRKLHAVTISIVWKPFYLCFCTNLDTIIPPAYHNVTVCK